MKMNLPRYSLDNPKVIWFFLAVLFIGGLVAFGHLGKKEDAPFVIKSASIVTRYPGATPEEVEQLITEPIEREIQSMRRVYKITSESFYGMSKIMIELLPSTPADEMPQMWDELRRKILTVQAVLPEGASPISVGDDYGDVFGIYYGLSADPGFTYEEMRDWAQRIKTELVPVDGVQKVTLRRAAGRGERPGQHGGARQPVHRARRDHPDSRLAERAGRKQREAGRRHADTDHRNGNL